MREETGYSPSLAYKKAPHQVFWAFPLECFFRRLVTPIAVISAEVQSDERKETGWILRASRRRPRLSHLEGEDELLEVSNDDVVVSRTLVKNTLTGFS